MNINFEYYRIFYTVATIGNITKAAQELAISQPAISKSIKHLEEQLGGSLFVRTKRGVVLTEEGREFYRYIKQAMEFINNAENKFSDLINLDVGTIRIGISTTLTKQFLIPYLEIFHKLYPKINIQIFTNHSAELFPKLRQGLLDLIILNLPYSGGCDIEIKEVKTIHGCFVVGDAYKYLCEKEMHISELNDYPLVLQTKGANTRTFLDENTAKYGVSLQPVMNLTSYTLVVEFAKIGFGIGYVTEEYIKDELKTSQLYKLNILPEFPERKIGLAYSNKNVPSFCARKLINIILNDVK